MLDHLLGIYGHPVTWGVLAFFLLLAALESAFPRRRLPRVPLWRLGGALSLLVAIGISGSVPLLWDAWFAEHRLIDARGLGTLGGAVAGFLTYQAGLYVWHRLLHRVPLLWRALHQMHHSAERIDVWGAYWFHPLDVVAFSALTSLCLVGVLGVSAEAALIASLAATACSLFQHANLRTPRWLGWLVQRPENHAVHHERGLHAFNYGDIALFDVLLGTFRNPRTHDRAAGFRDGASREVAAMLIGRDVSRPDEEREAAVGQGVAP